MASFANLNTKIIDGLWVVPDGDGTPIPASGTVTFEFPTAVKSLNDAAGNTITVPATIVGTINDNGALSMAGDLVTLGVVLPCTNDPDITETGWLYKVTIDVDGAVNGPDIFYMEVDVNGPARINLADIDRGTIPLPEFAIYATKAEVQALIDLINAGGGGGGVMVNGKLGPIITLSASDVGAASSSALNGLAPLDSPLFLGNPRGPTTPLGDDSLITKAYADTISAGVQLKTAARVATTAALANTPSYANGTLGVGATLTRTGNAAFPAIDGVTLVANERILVKDQAAPAQNGIYALTTVGSGAAPWQLTRVTDTDVSAELTNASVFINEGTANAGTNWKQNTSAPTVGTSAIVWEIYQSLTGTERTANKGVPSGYAPLDATGLVDESYIPLAIARDSAVQDVITQISDLPSDISAEVTTQFAALPQAVSTDPAKLRIETDDTGTVTEFDPSALALESDRATNQSAITFLAAAVTTLFDVGRQEIAVVAADVTHTQSNTALQNIAGLVIPITASATAIWQFEADLLLNAANTTVDCTFGWSVPAGCTMQWGAGIYFGVAFATTPLVLNTQAGTQAVGTVAGTTGVQIVGQIYSGGTAGNVQLRFAQRVSDATDLKILKGSVIKYTLLAG